MLPVLSIESLHVSYGGVQAVRGVSMEIPDGKVVAVLGSNGAGKTTLLRTISGTLKLHRGRVESGSVRFDGTDLVGRDPAQTVGMGLVQVPEGRRIFGRLTVEENLRAGGMGSKDKAAKAKAQARVFELFPVLKERSAQRGGLLSGGEQQMLAIGRALMASPKLLLLDEPSLGLAPRIIGQIGEVIAEINRQGTSVLLVEQNATMALGVANLAYVLDVGEVSLSGDARDPAACVASGLVQVPEGRRIFTRLTVEENLKAGSLAIRDRSSRADDFDRIYAMFPVLADRRAQRAGLLSGGEQQMLAMGRGLMARPKLLLLDEPSLGLAPRIIGQIGEVIREINRQGTSVLLVEQNATMALGVADSAFVLDVGTVSLSGPAAELAKTDAVQRLYLGHGSEEQVRRPAMATTGRRLTRWSE